MCSGWVHFIRPISVYSAPVITRLPAKTSKLQASAVDFQGAASSSCTVCSFKFASDKLQCFVHKFGFNGLVRIPEQFLCIV